MPLDLGPLHKFDLTISYTFNHFHLFSKFGTEDQPNTQTFSIVL